MSFLVNLEPLKGWGGRVFSFTSIKVSQNHNYQDLINLALFLKLFQSLAGKMHWLRILLRLNASLHMRNYED